MTENYQPDMSQEILLPTRDFLRQFIAQPVITAKTLKDILRDRGVFCSSSDKADLGTILIKTGLSPYEFQELKALLKIKESTPKFKTRTIKWVSDKDLIDCLPDINYDDLIDSQFETLRLLDVSNFTLINHNPNHGYIDFELERDDLLQNLGKNKTKHKGQIEFKSDSKTGTLTMSLTHTADETSKFCDKVVKRFIQTWTEKDFIPKDEELLIIGFADFDNKSRIAFFKELTRNPTSLLKFKDTENINFGPDEEAKTLPPEIHWMENRVNSSHMGGKDLHSLFFVSDEKILPYIKLYGVKCNYDINYEDITGTASIDFEFSSVDVSNKSLNELVLTIKVSAKQNKSSISRSQLEKEIIASIEVNKLKFYQQYAKKS